MSDWKEKGYVPVAVAPDYWINNMGDVIGRSGMPMTQSSIRGYRVVTFTHGRYPNYTRKTHYTHRLVAEAFVEKPKFWTTSWQVQPRNGSKLDISADNLIWLDGTDAYWHRKKK